MRRNINEDDECKLSQFSYQMEQLTEKLDKEIEEFHYSYKNMTYVQIYNDWYIIGFYESYFDLLTSGFIDDRIKEETVKWLLDKEKPLAFLYSEWLRCDDPGSLDWDDMLSWLENLCDEETMHEI